MRTTEPPRPLATDGMRLWTTWRSKVTNHDVLLRLCEASDERVFLRTRVLRGDAAPSERDSLRRLDEQIADLTASVKADAAWKRYATTRRKHGS